MAQPRRHSSRGRGTFDPPRTYNPTPVSGNPLDSHADPPTYSIPVVPYHATVPSHRKNLYAIPTAHAHPPHRRHIPSAFPESRLEVHLKHLNPESHSRSPSPTPSAKSTSSVRSSRSAREFRAPGGPPPRYYYYAHSMQPTLSRPSTAPVPLQPLAAHRNHRSSSPSPSPNLMVDPGPGRYPTYRGCAQIDPRTGVQRSHSSGSIVMDRMRRANSDGSAAALHAQRRRSQHPGPPAPSSMRHISTSQRRNSFQAPPQIPPQALQPRARAQYPSPPPNVYVQPPLTQSAPELQLGRRRSRLSPAVRRKSVLVGQTRLGGVAEVNEDDELKEEDASGKTLIDSELVPTCDKAPIAKARSVGCFGALFSRKK